MAVDTSNIDLVAIYERETGISLSKPQGLNEKASCKGPCFLCGGDDRFGAFLNDNPPHYHCGVNEGNGCGWHGDVIDLVRKIHGFTFTEACVYLEIPLDGTEYQGTLQREVRALKQDVAPGLLWQKRGIALVKEAQAFLRSDDPVAARARNYLRKRGLANETIKQAGLGYLPESRYEQCADWGLPESVDREGKKHTKLLVPRGWLIPWLLRTDPDLRPELWRIDIRRHPQDLKAAESQGHPIGKYHKLAGSSDGLYNLQAIREGYPLLVVESPLDALVGQQETSDEFRWVATGGTGGARSEQWRQRVAQAYPVLIAFDNDQPGSKAFADWRDQAFPVYRWTPTAHDINDMLLAGANIEEWVVAGVEMALLLEMRDCPV